MRKALSVVLTLAILMSVCAVMLSTLATAYTVDGTATTETKTYVYNFIDDATGKSSYSADKFEYNANGTIAADQNGLLATMPETKGMNNGGASLSAAFAIKLKDNDVNLGSTDGYFKFEANTDYAISIKFKVNNETNYTTTDLGNVRLAGGIATEESGTAVPEKFRTTKYSMYSSSFTKATTSSTDGWKYLSYDVHGSNAIKRGATSYDTTGKDFWILIGHNGATPLTNLEILIESVTVTVKECTEECATGDVSSETDAGTDFIFVAEKAADGSVICMNPAIVGQEVRPSKNVEFYSTANGATETTYTVAADQTSHLHLTRNARYKTQEIVFDMTTADAATAYSTLGHDKLSNVSGQGNSSDITTAGGTVSHVDATNDDESLRGLYFTSYYNAANATYTGYGSLHKAYIKNTRNNLDYYNGYLKVLAGKTYYIDLEYVLVRDGYSTSAEPTISLGITASGNFHLFEKHLIDKNTTKTSQHVTAVVNGDGNYNGTAYAGNMIVVNVSQNTTILIKKVTAYVCDNNVQTGDEVYQLFDGEIQKKVVGATLVDPASVTVDNLATVKPDKVSVISSKGWLGADGNPVKTVEAKQLSKYSADRSANIITFDKGKGIAVYRNSLHGFTPSFVSDEKGGKAFSVTNTDTTQNAYFVLGVNDDIEYGKTKPSDYNFVDGKTYTLSFKYKITGDNIIDLTNHLRIGYTTIGEDGTSQTSWGTGYTDGGTVVNQGTGATWNSYAKKFNAADKNKWITETFKITWEKDYGNAIMIGLFVDSVTVVLDDFAIFANDDIRNDTSIAVGSGIRAEKVDGTKYTSAGVRFRARLSDSLVGDNTTTEIGFIAAPQSYADDNLDWYKMENYEATGTPRAAWCKHLDRGVNKIYEKGTGYNDYQVVLTGLTQNGASKNAKDQDISVVLFYRLTNGQYRYYFVRSSSYNEVKQMLADAGYGVTGY